LIAATIPYAGITRVRFKGFDLSLIPIPAPGAIFVWQSELPAPLISKFIILTPKKQIV
jgi:hypothetical protein